MDSRGSDDGDPHRSDGAPLEEAAAGARWSRHAVSLRRALRGGRDLGSGVPNDVAP